MPVEDSVSNSKEGQKNTAQADSDIEEIILPQSSPAQYGHLSSATVTS